MIFVEPDKMAQGSNMFASADMRKIAAANGIKNADALIENLNNQQAHPFHSTPGLRVIKKRHEEDVKLWAGVFIELAYG